MNISNPAGEIDDHQAVAEKAGVFAELHQVAGMNLIDHFELGDAAAAAGDVESPSRAAQDRAFAGMDPEDDSQNRVLKTYKTWGQVVKPSITPVKEK